MTTLILACLTVGAIVTVLAMGIGMVWHGPLFGDTWARIVGMKTMKEMTPEEKKACQKGMGPTYALQIVATLTQFSLISFFGVFVGRLNLFGTVIFYCLLWLAFVVPLMAGGSLWAGLSRKQAWQKFMIGAGYQLVCFLIAAVVWAFVFPKFF
jgi:Protein of unknown function (DUF1761)